MGMVIEIPQAGLDYVIYGDKSNVLTNYLYNQIQQLPKQFNEFSARIYDGLNQAYSYVTDKLTQYNIMNEITKTGLYVDDNYVRELLEFNQLQEANLTMQRWIMAHSRVRELYLNNNIDGYSGSYVNIHGNTIGSKNYDYRRVMDGILVDNDPEYSWKVSFYDDELEIGDRELERFEKMQIINTWNAVDWMLDNCKFDFTHRSEEPNKINL